MNYFLLCTNIFLFVMANLITSVDTPTSKYGDKQTSGEIHYRWDEPDKMFYLPAELNEISGMTYNPRKNVILCVQDEEGFYYEIDPLSAQPLSETYFNDKGDYEGIAMYEGELIILESNGDVYHIKDDIQTKINTPLKTRNDTEGLCFSPDGRHLYIACKGFPLGAKKQKNTKAIYRLELSSSKMEETPFIKIDIDDLEKFYDQLNKKGLSKSKRKKEKNRIKSFSPSAIAIHPDNQDTYILSARGSILTILDKYHQIKSIILLNDNINPQPEGICFDPDGTLYISTEGQGILAKLFVYHKI